MNTHMTTYGFFVAQLRFVAAKTARETPEVEAMMGMLERIAEDVETTDGIYVDVEDLHSASRALAGLAGFLQQHILPEAVAAKHELGERQVRWVIDTSMELMAALTVHADADNGESKEGLALALPAPPQA